MKGFFSRISPKRAVVDFRDHWQQPTPHRWQILGVAMAATFCIFMLFVPDSQRAPPARPEIQYISTLDDSLSEEQIIAANCANQELKDALQARLDESAARQREAYAALGRATFIDVDAMQAEIDAERAAAEAESEGPSEEELALSVEQYCARATG